MNNHENRSNRNIINKVIANTLVIVVFQIGGQSDQTHLNL